MKKIKVLFVCLGNICRSPLAEAILKTRVKERGLEKNFKIDSCGTANYHVGETADERTIANALENGVKIRHSARQLSAEDLDRYDLILAMDKDNYAVTRKLAGGRDELRSKIKLLREYDVKSIGGDVPDPYYGGREEFQQVFNILNRSVENLLNELQSELLSPD
jgi:protein-tyrosine phosphatase